MDDPENFDQFDLGGGLRDNNQSLNLESPNRFNNNTTDLASLNCEIPLTSTCT